MLARNETLPQYIPSVAKALEVILWLAEQRKDIDVYRLMKAAFFADKYHVAKFGRPIVGDVYHAVWWGALPEVIHGLLDHQPPAMLALGNKGPLPFKVDDVSFYVQPEREPIMDRLSESDIEALKDGLSEVDGKSFDELLEQTHRDPAYRNAGRFGVMDYRDFIPESDPGRDEKISHLEETARVTVF